MIKTVNISIEDVPDGWIYEHYLGISINKPTTIKSVFNENDSNPSMKICKKGDRIVFFDFSTGINGSAIDLVMNMFHLDFKEAVRKIIDDYSINNTYTPKTYVGSSYKVTEVHPRDWNNIDINYWSQYHISKCLLELYNVTPISSYVMSNGSNNIEMSYNKCYCFHDNNMQPYKIYQPGNKKKFLKCNNQTIQGLEQLTYSRNTLVICSSLKDLMCLVTCVPEVEAIAPDSENTPLPIDIIEMVKKNYRNVFVMFDNDTAGLTNMYRYKRDYNIDYLHLNIQKDIADCVKAHGINNTRYHIINLLKNKLQN